MKKNLRFFAVITALIFIAPPGLVQKTEAQATASFQVFYDNLAPYGVWIDDATYGYVWVPDVDDDFRPYYSRGYWVMTEYGNTWVSHYTWGWAPFHYGRWTFDPYYGWIWIPGYEWGPAWVSWRWGNGYYGWAPLAPGVGIDIAISAYNCPHNWWIFIPPHYIHHHRFHKYVYGPRNSRDIINHTTIINNTYINRTNNVKYATGPRVEDIEKVTNRSATLHNIEKAESPGEIRVSRNTVKMYRPELDAGKQNNMPLRTVKAPQPIKEPQEISTAPEERVFKTNRNVPRIMDKSEWNTPIGDNPPQRRAPVKTPAQKEQRRAPINPRNEARPVQQPATPRQQPRSIQPASPSPKRTLPTTPAQVAPARERK